MSMQLFFDDDAQMQVSVSETLNESGKAEKKYHIKGVFSTIGEKNRNGRIYPQNLWEREINAYQTNIKNGTINTLMEYEHPARTEVDPMKAVAKIEKLAINGKYVMGEAVLLDNPAANQLKSLIDNGIKISVSSRGVGSVKNGVVNEFKLITYDIVSAPSDYNATMNGMCESFALNEGVVQGLSVTEEHGKYICQSEQEKQDYQKAIQSRFNDFVQTLINKEK